MSQRSYLSGSAKRKIKVQRDEITKKISGSIFKYTVNVSENKNRIKDAPIVEFHNQHLKVNECEQHLKTNECDQDLKTNECEQDLKTNECEQESYQVVNVMPCKDTEETLNSSSLPYYDSYPALWIKTDDNMIEYFVKNPPPQNLNLLPDTQSVCSGIKRSLTVKNFYHVKKMGKNTQKVASVVSLYKKVVLLGM